MPVTENARLYKHNIYSRLGKAAMVSFVIRLELASGLLGLINNWHEISIQHLVLLAYMNNCNVILYYNNVFQILKKNCVLPVGIFEYILRGKQNGNELLILPY